MISLADLFSIDAMRLLATLYFFLPVFIANATPVVIKNVPVLRDWNTPLHAIWFGKNKTYRGFVFGILFAKIFSILQYLFLPAGILWIGTIVPVVDLWHAGLFGVLMGAGALFGDIAESFVKRRIGIKPGDMFFPWDGIDYVVGAIIFMLPFYVPSILEVVFLLIVGPLVSGIANLLAFLVGWKKVPY